MSLLRLQQFKISEELNLHTAYDPGFLLLDITQEQRKLISIQNSKKMFIEASFAIAKTWESPKLFILKMMAKPVARTCGAPGWLSKHQTLDSILGHDLRV